MITEESIRQEYEEFLRSGKEITVEYATLQEINQVMVEHGLEPFTEEDRRLAMNYRYDCEDIIWYGDWTNNGVLSTLDIVYAAQYILEISGYTYSEGGYVYKTTEQDPTLIQAVKFGFLSSEYYNGIDGLRLDEDDIDIARWWILGIICYP